MVVSETMGRPATAAFVRDRTTWLAYLAVGMFSFLEAGLGPAMPFIRSDLDFGYAIASFHFSAFALGFVAVGLVGHRLTGTWGRARSFWRGLAAMTIAALVLVASPVYVGTILATFGIGFGGAFFAMAIQATLAERHGVHRAQALAEMNFAASVCAVSATVAVAGFGHSPIGWRGAVLVAVVACCLIAYRFRTVVIAEAVSRSSGADQRESGGKLSGTFWAFAFVLFLGVSVEWCFGFWGADFLQKEAGLAKATSAGAMSAFFVAMAAGRFVGSRLAGRHGSGRLLMIALLVSLVGFGIFWLAPVAALTLVGLFVGGLGVANFFPFAYTAALESALDRTDIATARLSLTGGSAVLLLPLTLGLLADATGIYTAFAIVLPLLLTGVVTVLRTEARGVRREA